MDKEEAGAPNMHRSMQSGCRLRRVHATCSWRNGIGIVLQCRRKKMELLKTHIPRCLIVAFSHTCQRTSNAYDRAEDLLISIGLP